MWSDYGLSFRLSGILELIHGTKPRACIPYLRNQVHMLRSLPQSWSNSESTWLIQARIPRPHDSTDFPRLTCDNEATKLQTATRGRKLSVDQR